MHLLSAPISPERLRVSTQHPSPMVPTFKVPYIRVSECYSRTQIKETVSNKTTSRLAMAECYQDNSIETPLKQEQNSGCFLAKLITDYYYFLKKKKVKLLSWEPDIPM